jgi:hypothetical protein
MLDIKSQILLEMQTNTNSLGSCPPPSRDLARVESALMQVHCSGINESGWFSDFLATYVAMAYGVSILIIRQSGIFTFIQVRS